MTVNEWRNEWVNDKVDEWMGQQAIVQKNERMCEWLTVLMIILWMIDWKILIVWMLYGRICQRDLVCRHSYALWESKSKKNVLYTWNRVKPSKKSYFGPFFEKFCSLSSFHHRIYARHISGQTITGLPGVTLVKIA